MRILLIIWIAFASLSFSFKKEPIVSLKRIKLFGDKIELKIPSTFKILAESKFTAYYPKENTPKIVYTNENKEIRIAFFARALNSSESLLRRLSTYEYLIEKTYSKVKLKDDGAEQIDNLEVVYTEFIIKKPEKYYRLDFFTTFKGQLLSCTFHAPKKKHKPWKLIAHEIMQSLTFKN
jgi:hypothetical protein